MINNIDQAIIITNMDGTIEFWNKYAEELYLWKAEEVIGKNIGDVIVPQIKAKQAEGIMKQLQKGHQWQGSFSVQNKIKQTFEAYVIDHPIMDNNGELKWILGISHDLRQIIELKKNELSKTMSGILNANLSNLFANVTHQFNNHIMEAMANLHLLQMKIGDEEDITKHLSNISKSLKNLSSETNQIQLLTRKKSTRSTIVNLTNILEDMNKLSGLLSEKSLKIESNSDELPIIMDLISLEKLIINILQIPNKQKPQSLSTQFTTEIKCGKQVLSNSDVNKFHGPGNFENHQFAYLSISLPKKVINTIENSISKPFFSENISTHLISSAINGLLDAYSGLLEIKNDELKFYFPLVENRNVTEQDNDNLQYLLYKKSNVLIAEDNDFIRDYVATSVRNLGFNPIICKDGQEAINQLQTRKSFAMCILDLKMPVKNGIEVTKVAQRLLPHSLIIIISGFHKDIDLLFEDLEKLPIFLSKPFTSDQFEELINNIAEIKDPNGDRNY